MPEYYLVLGRGMIVRGALGKTSSTAHRFFLGGGSLDQTWTAAITSCSLPTNHHPINTPEDARHEAIETLPPSSNNPIPVLVHYRTGQPCKASGGMDSARLFVMSQSHGSWFLWGTPASYSPVPSPHTHSHPP